MSKTIAKINEKGKIMIHQKILKETKLKESTCVSIKTKDKSLIIDPAESVAEKYCGLVKVEKWPENLDEFAAEATKKATKKNLQISLR